MADYNVLQQKGNNAPLSNKRSSHSGNATGLETRLLQRATGKRIQAELRRVAGTIEKLSIASSD